MANKSSHRTLAVILTGFALTVAANAQSSEPVCSIGFHDHVRFVMVRNINVAYIATTKTTFDQSLPDGNHIKGYIYAHQARDSAGRTMIETGVSCYLDANGVPRLQSDVSVYDPSTKTTLLWQIGNSTAKVVRVAHRSETQSRTPTTEELEAHTKTSEVQRPSRSEFKFEDLGFRTIAGVVAHGSRNTRTIPPEEEGNELPLVTFTETWSSKDLGLEVMVISDDPRRGRTTYEVKELSRTEPDPAAFAPPEGYRIEDLSSQTTPVSLP